MKNIQIILSIVTLTLVCACKPLQYAEKSTLPKVPERFTQNSTSSVAVPTWQETIKDQNLKNLIDSCLKNNPDMLIAEQRIKMLEATVKENKGLLLPQVNLNVSPSIRRFGFYTMDGAGNATTDITPGRIVPVNLPDFYTGLQTSWEIDIWGKLRSQKKASQERFLAGSLGRDLLKTNLINEVVNTYYAYLSINKQLSLYEETLALRKSALETIIALKEAGKTNELAIKQFENEILTIEKEYLELQATLKEQELNVMLLSGTYQKTSFSEQAIRDTSFIQFNFLVPSEVLAKRLDVQMAEKELEATKFDLKASKMAFYPSLTLNGFIGAQAFNPAFWFQLPTSLAYNATGSLLSPLINRSAIKARFQQANANQIEALYSYQKTILSAYVELEQLMNTEKNLKAQYKVIEKKVKTNLEAVEISSDLFKNGRINSLELLVSQQNLLEAKLELIILQELLWRNTFNQYKASGTLIQ
jgi:outer membrane protein, multidrug efflux system